MGKGDYDYTYPLIRLMFSKQEDLTVSSYVLPPENPIKIPI
jgi:hypothetical protein